MNVLTRRGLLSATLAACAAPAIITRPGALMRVRPVNTIDGGLAWVRLEPAGPESYFVIYDHWLGGFLVAYTSDDFRIDSVALRRRLFGTSV